MHHTQKKPLHFGMMCRMLRERANYPTTHDAARQLGHTYNVLYRAENAEPGTPSISIKKLKEVYRPLCESEEEFLKLLFLWAVNQVDHELSDESMSSIVAEQADPEQYGTSLRRIAKDSEISIELASRVLAAMGDRKLRNLIVKLIEYNE